MKVRYRDLSVSDPQMKKDLLNAVDNVLTHGQILHGPEVKKFEEFVSRTCGTKHAVGVGCGTDALHLSLNASQQQSHCDHNPRGFTVFLAGGGIKPGISYGATDEIGGVAVENRIHMRDLHATILYALGLDHEQLTYRYAGRDFRLTDVEGHVVHDLFA